jgi:hypothetical protein
LQAYQARNLDVSKERAFNATVVVMQDLGCIITSADIRTGYISAQSLRTTSSDVTLAGFKNLKLTAFVLPHGKGRSRVRLTAVRSNTGSLFSFGWSGFFSSDDRLVENATMYERFFARILETLTTESLDRAD